MIVNYIGFCPTFYFGGVVVILKEVMVGRFLMFWVEKIRDYGIFLFD